LFSIRQMQISPAGMNTFNNTSGALIASLNNMLGTTDLSANRNVDMVMGKTPQALKMQAIKESAADSWERQSLEQALEDLYDRFVDLLAVKQEKPIDLRLFRGSIEETAKFAPDVMEIVGPDYKVKPGALRGRYKFFIDTSSTVVKDMAIEHQAITNILAMFMKAPQLVQVMRAKGKDIDFAELINRMIITSGLQGADRIITDYKPEGVEGAPATGGPQTPPPQSQQPPQPQPRQMPQFKDEMVRQVAEQLFRKQ